MKDCAASILMVNEAREELVEHYADCHGCESPETRCRDVELLYEQYHS